MGKLERRQVFRFSKRSIFFTAVLGRCRRREISFLGLSELELNTALEKLRIPLEIESIETAVSVIQLQAHVLREVPVHLGSDSAESTTRHILVVEIAVRVSKRKFSGSRAALKDCALGIDVSKVTSDRVVNACGIVEQVAHNEAPAIEHRIVLSLGRDKDPPIFTPQKPAFRAVIGFISGHAG